MDLAVDLLRDHLRLADGELETLAPHVLDEDGQRQLAAALHLPRVGAADVDDLERDVSDELAVEAVLHHAGGELVPLHLADQRRGVRADRHRDRWVVDVDRLQRTHIVRVGDGLADGDVLEPSDRGDVARAGGISRVALQGARHQQLGDAGAADAPVGADPGDGLPLLQRAVEDAQQSEAAEERAGVEVGDPRLQRCLIVVGRCRDVRENRFEQRLEIAVVRQLAVGRAVSAGGAGAPGGVDHRNVQERIDVEIRHIVDEVGGQTQEQIVRLFFDLDDPGVGPVGLVDEQDDGKLRLERLAQHEAGLRQRAL